MMQTRINEWIAAIHKSVAAWYGSYAILGAVTAIYGGQPMTAATTNGTWLPG